MNKWYLLSLVLLTGGVVFLVLGIIRGEVELGIAVIIPFMIGSGIFAGAAFLCLAGFFVCFFLGMMQSTHTRTNALLTHEKQNSSIKTGGVVFIGPLPIIFGSNWKIALAMMVLALVLIVAAGVFLLSL